MRLFFFFILLSSGFGTELQHDFDRDGKLEKIVGSEESNPIYQETTTGWTLADYTLPEGIKWKDTQGNDTGLKFVDLNEDGFDDILYSNEKELAIFLWNKEVKPNLGWTKGWSQKVRIGSKTGNVKNFPSLVGKQVTSSEGYLIIKEVSESMNRWKLRDLIAVELPAPKSPTEALKSFTTAPGFKVELVASEPQVIDPIAVEWDDSGVLWVVEMRDYPLGVDGKGKPGGVVKRLFDQDGDGFYETSKVFLDGIPFPTGVFPWKKGALITSAPHILYAEDADGDGKAERTEILFTGFHPGNQQHLVNGFELGLDGWIYVANGDSGGTVKSIKTGKELSIRGRDLRFKPETGEMETVSSQTQFGLRRDDWGNWFGNNNSNWLWHVTLPDHYLKRNPKVAVKAVRNNVATYHESSRVFPTSTAMERPNQPWSLNHVTSACSPLIYRDSLFGTAFRSSAFISEPVHNLVHREVLEPDGISFKSQRAKEDTQNEFLSSSDHWFRPTGLKVGPDGALYVADMYRFVVEHPEWISAEMQARMDIRAGEDKGRIYRIAPVDEKRRNIPSLRNKSAADLVKSLNSPSGWQRDHAMKRLLELQDTGVSAALENLVDLKFSPEVRLQAIATLGALKTLKEEILIRAYADPHPAIRVEALRQTDHFLPKDTSLLQEMRKLASDPEITVRRQLAFTLGEWPQAMKLPILTELASESDEPIHLAVMTSLHPHDPLFLDLQAKKAPAKLANAELQLKPTSADRATVIHKYDKVRKLKGDAQNGKVLFESLCAICHTLRGTGQDLGPDLGMVSTKPIDWLLNAILDPNQVVESRYQAWQITTHQGQIYVGTLSAETTNNLVLKLPGGLEHAVLRQDIKSLQSLPSSLMPTGFESALPPQPMRDLIEWLQLKDTPSN